MSNQGSPIKKFLLGIDENDLPDEVDEVKPQSNLTQQKSLGYQSSYSSARTIADVLSVIGWLTVVIGVFSALALASQGSSFDVFAMLPGLGLVISGLFMVVAAQVTRAIVDNADHTREILSLLREKA
ncbi:hypothetical protein [Litoribrevibacter albus]|uniref:Uncharacterized protein n=1 Tax=Litoribrevibacter albus TaxID=1473156 RepID=A0AA37SE64_9GAMM|nr:hypothetical protein [Litoribrevibacter albus]GLQ32612.1 hypothetical protein GCM10007876_30910 [Litoribrevibacter albus]